MTERISNVKDKLKEYGTVEKTEILASIKAIRLKPQKTKSLKDVGTEKSWEETFKNTVELNKSALTALFLAQARGIWGSFPLRMKQIWVLCVIVASAIPWFSCLILQVYFFDSYKHGKHFKHGHKLQYYYNMLCASMLF
ncbi:hypothetical protein RFI_19850, partial [Reticulomyxa filosa]